ncbi:MFS-type transporter SLC18B1-like [Amphibalanus amphitrite]|uniref:MFS-type transporter SLC18B1-like n=1 Tax=Amphibalanus amphitrite TaxID=1232801 RepID=UPI001C9071B8|nr:MFS-type transporter SLC18B1-like [Amphibalanus amphitrite]
MRRKEDDGKRELSDQQPQEKSDTTEDCRTTEEAPGETYKDASGSPSKISSHQRRLLVFLGAATVLAGCCTLVQVPFFPHEARLRGLTSAQSSVVFSSFSLSELLSFPVTGWLAPRLGVMRLFHAGVAIAGVTGVAFGLVGLVGDSTAFLSASVAVRVAEAVGTAAVQTAARTIVASQFPERLNTVLGFIETMSGAGLCLGPALGGALYALGGYGLSFYFLGGLQLLLFVAGVVMMPTELPSDDDQRQQQKLDEDEEDSSCWRRWRRSSFLRMLALIALTPDNWLTCAALLVVAHNWLSVDPQLEVYVHDTLDISPAELGLFFLGSFVVYAAAGAAWGRLSDAVENTFLLVSGFLSMTALGVLLMPPSPLFGLPPSRLLLGFGMGIRELFQAAAYPILLGLLLRRSIARGLPDTVQGRALVAAVYGTVYSRRCPPPTSQRGPGPVDRE